MKWRRRFRPFWKAYLLWLRADCVDLSAAFAYHTLQSFFPALLIALSVASRVLGRDLERFDRLIVIVSQVLPPSALPGFEATLRRFTNQGFGAGILGLVLLGLSASNIYLTLQRGADRLWWNRPFGFDHLSWKQHVRRFLALRLKALVLLLFVGLLIVVDQLFSTVRLFGSRGFHDQLQSFLPEPLLWINSLSSGLDLLISLPIGFGATLLFLWMLPSRRIPIRPLVPGALLVSGSLTLSNLLLGRSLLALGLRFQAYGVVGGVLLLTLWVWLVGAVLYLGQCFSVVLSGGAAGGPSTPLPR
ncbi:YhjD/YihY/BrkB family envelope integrity protein [Cyanobium gracile UHCC 0139]|uniref:YhjD/YihY/BrkB family envelope integrity protein n=1 Tax=Cyanobium gracile UHCC 0139 TaxID=3110308 RepID=A0ABU5RY99_9CYAN|nr:YhjD/YihY/BrkB family envelope integrity protein [Cyanobium gracile]MEA5392738.1 YhjD/YihY/BrkB family envelope integrity protein [Cyanobium gracile UHCC 0139]